MGREKVLVMGVAGCGKSTLAGQLAHTLGAVLIEGDDHHPRSSKEKMRNGIALQDSDREPWLDKLGALLAGAQGSAVLTCSALKRSYRDRLRSTEPALRIVYIDISPAEAHIRVASRTGHLFPPGLVASQFQSLEVPAGEPAVLRVHARQSLVAQIRTILSWLGRTVPDEKGFS